MPSKQADHPNLNSGGNEGNVFGAGPHRKSFRAKAARAASEGLDFWIAVAKGHKVIPVADAPKGREKRAPTFKERREAYSEILLRFGVGTQDEVVVLASDGLLDAVADVLAEMVEDPDLVDRLLVAIGERLGGQGP